MNFRGILYFREVAPYDIALMKLEKPFELNPFVATINLPHPGSVPEGPATLTGWGSIGRSRAPNNPVILQSAILPILDYDICHRALDKVLRHEGRNPLHPTNVCTGPLDGTLSACKVRSIHIFPPKEKSSSPIWKICNFEKKKKQFKKSRILTIHWGIEKNYCNYQIPLNRRDDVEKKNYIIDKLSENFDKIFWNYFQGDSGGPLVRLNSFDQSEIIGIVSWGLFPCGGRNAPSVYTRVSAFVPWIIKIIYNHWLTCLDRAKKK